ncbi:metal-dependent transcriptional regulator [Dysosmobacter sp.]|uniref:metal-dependent transcriptional regulator n=1 Tax=Dysosmobacter sp. TaxID=2591382 RepID=UPI00307B8882
MKLYASGEDYLEAILVLQKKLGMVRSVDVARHMEVSKPSVCHAVATLQLITAGVDPKTAEADACRIEHTISQDSFEKIRRAHEQGK